MTDPQLPSVGRIVHYVSYGTPGGEYDKTCRATVVTNVPNDPGRPTAVGVMVCNPTGIFFQRVDYHNGAETPGDLTCPDQQFHGNPHRYCSCGWMEASHKGGTWHWPERA